MGTQKQKTNNLVSINDSELYVEKAGKGDAVLFIHAGVADNRMWDKQFDFLSKTHTVIRFDMRGFGDSKMSSGLFSYHQDVAAILAYFEIKRATIIGASFGGYVAINFALSHPELVEKLILANPALDGYKFKSVEMLNFFEEEDALLSKEDLVAATELNLKMWIDGSRRDAGIVNPEVRERVREMQMKVFSQPEVDDAEEEEIIPPALSRLGEIETPTLVISGNLDVAEFQEIAKLIARSISNAKLEIMLGVAHLPSMENAEEFNRTLFDFLE
ncbi:MAG: alpha/beta fold hydrolase [Chloroflexi bacterium]|nr:alpha/beta fold hydrolase [Chloroflexota bacterium]